MCGRKEAKCGWRTDWGVRVGKEDDGHGAGSLAKLGRGNLNASGTDSAFFLNTCLGPCVTLPGMRMKRQDSVYKLLMICYITSDMVSSVCGPLSWSGSSFERVQSGV